MKPNNQKIPHSVMAAVQDNKAADAPMKRSPDEFTFDSPGILVNMFQLALTPSYARLSALEISHGGTPHMRAALVSDYKTLEQLYNMMHSFFEARKKALSETEKVDETKGDPNAKSIDGSQAEVG